MRARAVTDQGSWLGREHVRLGNRSWLLLALIVLLMLGTYKNVVNNAFVFDDAYTVTSNPAVRSLAIDHWFLSPRAGHASPEEANYRPVLVGSYALDYAVWKNNPVGYHATNLAIHLVVVVLVFLLGRRAFGELPALFAAAVVALHPINSEAVNYITARSSSLMTLFVLAAVLMRDAASGTGRRAWLVPGYGFGLAAMGTKEVAVVLPLLMMVWDRIQGGAKASWQTTWRRSSPWWVLTGVFLLARFWVLSNGAAAVTERVSLGQGMLFAVKIYLTSLTHWFWPIKLSVDHAWPLVIGWGEGIFLGGAAGAAILGTIVVAHRDRQMGWCLAWFWLAVAPLGALPFVSRLTLYQENRLYLAGIALAWLSARALWIVLSRGLRMMHAPIALVVVTLVFGAVATDRKRTTAWSDSRHLWEDVLVKYPSSIFAYNNIGVNLLNAGRFDDARQAFETALKLAPEVAHTHYYLGRAYARLGDLERAREAFESALRIKPRFTAARLNLAQTHERLGRQDRAFDLYENLLRDDPLVPTALRRTGEMLEAQGRFEAAVERYQRYVAILPGDQAGLMALGGVLFQLKRWEEARAAFETVLAQSPHQYAARFNLGMTYRKEGRDDLALDQFQRAAAMNGQDPDVFFQIGSIHAQRSNHSAAIEAYQQALRLDPNHGLSHFGLAELFERAGDPHSAQAHWRAFLQYTPDEPDFAGARTQAEARLATLRQERLP